MKGKIIRRVGRRLATSWAVLVMCAAVSGQDDTSTTPDKQPPTPTEPAPEQPVLQFPLTVKPLPEGQTKVLTARVISVKGKVKWRLDDKPDKPPWNFAKVNDLLDPGTVIRTLTNSSITLRVGENVTMMISRTGRVRLVRMLLDGDVLETLVAMRYGRCDVKVDRVAQIGLTNDFRMITADTVLAVGGTGFAVTWGALEGVEIDALATNVIHAIEVRYLRTNMSYYLSGNGATRENQPDPVDEAWDKTISPSIPGGLSEGEFLAELQSERQVDYSRIGLEGTLAFVSGFEPSGGVVDDDGIVMRIVMNCFPFCPPHLNVPIPPTKIE